MNPARRGFQRRLDPEQRKSKRVWFRVTPDEYRALQRAAGKDLSDWLRAKTLPAAGIRLTAPSG